MARILLIVGGGIAAYKASELIRLARKAGHQVTPVLTAGGAHFITPMTLAALAESPVYTSLWDLKDETEMGHIQLSRAADLVLVCPATADLVAKMAAGIADDLATTLILATDKPVVIAPAMNHHMWLHEATQHNIRLLKSRGVHVIEPVEGDMACGEYGPGRLPEPTTIMQFLARAFSIPFVSSEVERRQAKRPSTSLGTNQSLAGKHVLVTAGPTHEPIDPVRVIANRSSGKQGFAIAAAAVASGARVTLVAGPVSLPTPGGVARIDVETAEQMAEAVEAALPATQPSSSPQSPIGRSSLPRPSSRKPTDRLGWSSNLIRTSLPRWRRTQCARNCWSALPPRPTISRPMPPPSGKPRAPTGSSPTTCLATSWAVPATRSGW